MKTIRGRERFLQTGTSWTSCWTGIQWLAAPSDFEWTVANNARHGRLVRWMRVSRSVPSPPEARAAPLGAGRHSPTTAFQAKVHSERGGRRAVGAGVRHIDILVTPERRWRTIRDARATANA